METEARVVPRTAEEAPPQRPPPREEMRPARGILIGLVLSSIFWLSLFVLWLSF